MGTAENEMRRVVAGALVGQLREQLGWTQGQLAEKIGVAQGTVSRIEHGQLEPDMAQLRALADAFGMKAPELLQLFDDAHTRAVDQANAAAKGSGGDGWKKVLAVMGAVGVAGLAGFAAALALKDRAGKAKPLKKDEDQQKDDGGRRRK